MAASTDETSLRGLEVWRESWLPANAKPSPPADCRCSPCTGFRCCCFPMFFLVFGIIGVLYAPYVLWLPHDTLSSQFCVAVFHLLILLLAASYVMAVFTDPGTTPGAWIHLVEAEAHLAAEHQLCVKSKVFRPLRSHYCSVTQRVVLNTCALQTPTNTT